MSATELALQAFLRRSGLMADARFYRLMSFEDRLWRLPDRERQIAEARADVGLRCGSVIQAYDRVLDSGAILYWADFLHAANYLAEIKVILAGLRVPVLAREADRALLLSDAPDEVLARTVSFGTSLLFNTAQDEAQGGYRPLMLRFARGVDRMWMRDAFSAARVAHLRQDYASGYFGVDAALLLNRSDIGLPEAVPGPSEGPVLTFMGRDASMYQPMTGVAAALGETLARPVHWLPWGDRLAFPELPAAGVPLAASESTAVAEMLVMVATASLVVTDTYHLAALAWRLGTPAVTAFYGHKPGFCDVSGGREFSWRDKREVLFSQYDALDFLVRPEELRDETLLARRIEHIRTVLCDQPLREAITGGMANHAHAMETDLAVRLKALLTSRSTAQAGYKRS